MLHAASSAAWRVVLLLALAFAPTSAPVDAIATGTTRGAVVRLLASSVVLATFAFTWRRMLRASRALAVLSAATLLGAAILSRVFDEEHGPLARGAVYLAPLAWSTAAVGVARIAALGATRRGWTSAKRAAALGAIAVGVVGATLFVTARDRLRRDRLWEEALALDPTNEPAAIALADKHAKAGDHRLAESLLTPCAEASRCSCAEALVELHLDRERFEAASTALERSASCPRTPRRDGSSAEIAASLGDLTRGKYDATSSLARDPREPHAKYALARAAMREGDIVEAERLAREAVDAGRGAPAHLLLGILLFQKADLDGAERHFRAVLALDPRSARATYNVARIAHERDLYGRAREGYLAALSLDPHLADARVNLVLLTHAHGARLEALHHLEELARRAPGDARIAPLRQMLESR
jgi:tetratricopeptide (TPR) repeat protein